MDFSVNADLFFRATEQLVKDGQHAFLKIFYFIIIFFFPCHQQFQFPLNHFVKFADLNYAGLLHGSKIITVFFSAGA